MVWATSSETMSDLFNSVLAVGERGVANVGIVLLGIGVAGFAQEQFRVTPVVVVGSAVSVGIGVDLDQLVDPERRAQMDVGERANARTRAAILNEIGSAG